MSTGSDMDVLVIVLGGSVHVGLARAAVRQGWTVLAPQTAVQALREIRDRTPRLVIVQVAISGGEPIRLIRMLRHSVQPVLIVAVASGHRDQLEKLARDAGASCYLPGAEDEQSLSQTVASMLEYAPMPAIGTGIGLMTYVGSSPLTKPSNEGVGR